MTDERPGRATIEEILAKFGQTSYGALLHDHQRRRHMLAEMMADSTDPVMREIGQQLRDGTATPRQIMAVPEYWESLQGGLRKLAEIDLDEIAEQVDGVLQRERDAAEREQGPAGR